MKRAIIVLSLLLIAAAPQSRRRAVNPPLPQSQEQLPSTPVPGPWSVDITTTGGFGGSGVGDIHVDSTGNLVVGQFANHGKQCTFVLTPTDIATIEARVLAARADLWVSSYVPANDQALCCDLVTTKVHLERRERATGGSSVTTARYTTQFLDTNVAIFPSDLKALQNLLRSGPDSYFGRYFPTCR